MKGLDALSATKKTWLSSRNNFEFFLGKTAQRVPRKWTLFCQVFPTPHKRVHNSIFNSLAKGVPPHIHKLGPRGAPAHTQVANMWGVAGWCHTFFPVVQLIGLQCSVLAESQKEGFLWPQTQILEIRRTTLVFSFWQLKWYISGRKGWGKTRMWILPNLGKLGDGYKIFWS